MISFKCSNCIISHDIKIALCVHNATFDSMSYYMKCGHLGCLCDNSVSLYFLLCFTNGSLHIWIWYCCFVSMIKWKRCAIFHDCFDKIYLISTFLKSDCNRKYHYCLHMSWTSKLSPEEDNLLGVYHLMFYNTEATQIYLKLYCFVL